MKSFVETICSKCVAWEAERSESGFILFLNVTDLEDQLLNIQKLSTACFLPPKFPKFVFIVSSPKRSGEKILFR